MIKRSDDSTFFPGKWDFPGGKINGDEDTSESAARETKEETSLDAVVGDVVLEGEHVEKGKTICYKIFSTSRHKGKIKLGKDHSMFMWISRDQIHVPTTPFVEKYLESLR